MPTKDGDAPSAQIAGKARFDTIRYAQLWEDADVLVDALGTQPGADLVSICSAGDNALAMLLLDPARVIAIDLSRAQLACLELRIAAIRELDHQGFLELLGSRPSDRRDMLLKSAIAAVDGEETRQFWREREAAVVSMGLAGVGKFEAYFALFRNRLLPLVHGQKARDDIFVPKPRAARQAFLDNTWNNWRWRLLMRFFFSKPVMGRLGRDPAFFDHVSGSAAEHVARRISHAAVELDPSENPYLHWIIKGTHGQALPLAWRPQHFETLRARLDRIELRHESLEGLVTRGITADGFNLSDIFEYMDVATFEAVYDQILAAARPSARLVYWNMMVPRRVPERFSPRITRCTDAEARGKAIDKAFFYSDFVVEEVAAV